MKVLVLMLLSVTGYSQTSDTLTNARSYKNTFLNWIMVGTLNNGHVYGSGFKLNFDINESPLAMDVVRIDFTTKEVLYKTMPGSISSFGNFWRAIQDSTGAWYTGLAALGRSIWKLNFKGDTVALKNLGTGSYYGEEALAYSIGLGRDKNMYFGFSSANHSTVVSYYNPYTDTMYKYPEIDDLQDYVSFNLGDIEWMYPQVGERSYNYLWAIRKSDGYKKKLDSVPSSTIFNSGVFSGGIAVAKGGGGDTYYLHDTTMSLSAPIGGIGTNVFYFEVNSDGWGYTNPSFKNVADYYNPSTSRLSYKVDNDTGSVLISSASVSAATRMVFTDYADTNSIYYVGDYYGNWYKYNVAAATSTELGLGGFNIYSWLQYNDSIFYMGGYPSGILVMYNKNQAWTAETFNSTTGSVQHLSATTNPKRINYFHSVAEISHTNMLLKTTDNYLVGAGDVIRTSNTSCIANYNPATTITSGYSADKMPVAIGLSGLAEYNGKVIMSTSGTGCKLYFYDYVNNVMSDSIDLGFTDYGTIYIIGDKLIGVANNRIYNYNLTARVLVNSHSYATNAITYNSMMPDGRILIKSTGITLPVDMTATFISYPYATSYGTTNYSNKYIYTTNSLGSLSKLKNYYAADAGFTTPEQRRIFTMRKLNLIQ